jgi:acetyltransferase-like isoleucine patch superfamily enzyme
MSFGPDLQLRSSVSSNPLGANHPVILATWQAGACLEVGARFCMTGGAICAAKHITIGNGVAVGANTIIADTDFHPIDAAVRWLKPDAGQAAAIVIADDVFIGMNCLILKGVVIGQGSVVGAGSVVTCAVPSHVIAAGNPAKIVREL